MATRPYKTTGCFKFALFIILLTPIAYLAASYYNGQDGIQNIKNFFSKAHSVVGLNQQPISQPSSTADEKNTTTAPSISDDKILEFQSTISIKDKEINALINDNLDLKMKLKECETKASASPKVK